MKKFCLIMLLGCSFGANSTFHEADVRYNGPASGYYSFTITTYNVSPLLDIPNMCNGAKYACDVRLIMQAVIGWNPTHIMASNLLVDKNPPSSCHTADCNVSLTGARTLGELVPLMKYRGAFGKPSTQFAAYSQRYRTCILVTWVQAQTTSQYYVDCSPVKETNAGCDINDDNAIIDFGTFSNDVKTRQANGSFRVHCANDSNIRVKFLSNSTKISLSDDGKLNAGLKIRNSTPGSTELESFIKLPAGEQKIFIDAELSNDKTSHVGPFSASVVAIVEVA